MSGQECDNSELQDDDKERETIRNELSTLSFEELQKLKERVGAKVYKEVVFGKKNKVQNEVYKRENKNRPREISSKLPVHKNFGVIHVNQTENRDPRFDPLCGKFDKKQFTANYNFLSDLRIKNMKTIKTELEQTTDPVREQNLRRLLQRLKDQHKEIKRQKVEKDMLREEKRAVEQQFKKGHQPHFKNKAETKVETLVKQYEQLKKEGVGRIQRHLKRRQQKIKKKSHRAPTGVI